MRAQGVSTVAFAFGARHGKQAVPQRKEERFVFDDRTADAARVLVDVRPGRRDGGFGWIVLLAHVFGSSALLRIFHTAAPRNRLVPDRV